MSQSQQPLFFRNLMESIMYLFKLLLTNIVLNFSSIGWDIKSRANLSYLIFQFLFDNEMHCQEECDLLTVVISILYNLNNNNNDTSRVKRSTEHYTAYPSLLMLCLRSLFVLSRAKMIINTCIILCICID